MRAPARTTHAPNMRAASCLAPGLALAGLVVLAPLGAAAAQSLDVDVAPGSCVDAAALTSALGSLDDGGAIGAHVAASKDISIRVAETEGQVSLEIREAGIVLGVRTIETKGLPCDEVVAAVALAMAVTIDALSNARGEPAVSPPPPVEHPPQRLLLRSHPSDSPEAAPADGPTDRGAHHLATSLELGWTLGMLPKTSATLAAMVDASIGSPPVRGVEPELSARAGFFSALPSGTGDTGPGGGEIVTSVVAGRLDLCGGVGSALVRLRSCASAVGGELVTVGGQDEGRLVAGGRLDVRWRAVDRLGLQAGADMLANIGPLSVTSRDGDGRIDHRKLGSFALVVGGGPVVEFF